MKEFTIKDYSLFEHGSTTILSSIDKTISEVKECSSIVEQLCSDEVFAGPISDSCKNGWTTISNDINSTVQELNSSVMYLRLANKEYVFSDKTNANEIGGVQW